MGRTNKLTGAQATLANAQTVQSAVTSVQLVGQAFEGFLWLGVFAYFTWRARVLYTTQALARSPFDPALYLADSTGFGIGPVVSTFMPGMLWSNLSHLANNVIGVQIVNANAGLYAWDTSQREREIKQQFDQLVRSEGWWELVYRYEPPAEKNPAPWNELGRFYLLGIRLQWGPALMFGVACTLVGKGAAGILKAVIP